MYRGVKVDKGSKSFFTNYKYYIVYKPFGMLSQFSGEGKQVTLADLGYNFPKDVYPVGRLDSDSEGLLFLTNDRRLNSRLLTPENGHKREYWVQVDGVPTESDLQILRAGVTITVNKEPYKTLPIEANIMVLPAYVQSRVPAVKVVESRGTCWLQLKLTEGKNRQVRHMTAKIGFPTLRLIRAKIGNLNLGELTVGGVKELPARVVFKALFETDKV